MTDATLIAALAKRFVANLREDLTPAQFAEVRRRNATPQYRDHGSCASHDFCDANMVMLDAFERVVGREPRYLDGTDAQGNHTPEQEADIDLWNAAWEHAVTTELRHDA